MRACCLVYHKFRVLAARPSRRDEAEESECATAVGHGTPRGTGSSMLGLWSHEDEEDQPAGAGIHDPMLEPGRRQDGDLRPEVSFLVPHTECAAALQDHVHLVRIGMDMRLLRLSRLTTVEIAEETIGLEETGLDHFLGGEPPDLVQLHPAPPAAPHQLSAVGCQHGIIRTDCSIANC